MEDLGRPLPFLHTTGIESTSRSESVKVVCWAGEEIVRVGVGTWTRGVEA